MDNIYLLKDEPNIDSSLKGQIISDYEEVKYEDMGLESYILEKYNLDVSGKYGDLVIKNPFGKASGQLSSNISQIKTDAIDGLGFVVIKTVISQDEKAKSSMEDWKVKAPKMVVEEIISERGEKGYTVTWKGRGWDKSFEDYLELISQSFDIYKEAGMPVIPSVQYHLPTSDEEFRESEYEFTTKSLEKVWKESKVDLPFIIEQDFSATLSGLKNSQEEILRWLREVPRLIDKYIDTDNKIIGVKLFNPLYDDNFQVDMVKTLNEKVSKIVDTITCFNRLFNLDKVFEGKKGIAYGGYDLSDRNLRVLSKFVGGYKKDFIPISATGNINSGKMMVEYALRGATSGQIHTYFQIPSKNYRLKEGSRTKKALHELMFNPTNGLVVAMISLRNILGINEDKVFKFLDIAKLHREINLMKLK
jgi:dihydroorotate dehydrogenase